jgi:hypothetical protein
MASCSLFRLAMKILVSVHRLRWHQGKRRRCHKQAHWRSRAHQIS